jgi:hypothetical protein
VSNELPTREIWADPIHDSLTGISWEFRLIARDGVARQIHCYHIDPGLRQLADVHKVKSDLQFLLVHSDPQISVIHIVVVLQDEPGRSHDWLTFEVMNVSSKVRLAWELASFAFHHAIYVVTSIATYDKRHFIRLVGKTNTSRKPLVVVRVSG